MRSAFVPGAAAAATVATRKAMTARARVMYFMSVSLGGYRRPQGETGVRVSSERSEDGAQRNRERRVEGADICARGRGKFIRQARDADAAKCWQMQILARSRTARNTLPYSHRAWRATPHSRRGFQSSERSGRDALDSQPAKCASARLVGSIALAIDPRAPARVRVFEPLYRPDVITAYSSLE